MASLGCIDYTWHTQIQWELITVMHFEARIIASSFQPQLLAYAVLANTALSIMHEIDLAGPSSQLTSFEHVPRLVESFGRWLS